MAEVLFYHLERSTVDQVLPTLLEKVLERGWRAVVKTGSVEAAAALDADLWAYAEDSFLPHGIDDSTRQPVFILGTDEMPDGFDVLFLVAGGQWPVGKFTGFTRTVVMFRENEAAMARELWKDVKAEGLNATYWRQSPSGRWEKAA